MIGLAAAVILLAAMSASAMSAAADASPLSVAVQASGSQDVSYAIVVRNSADYAVPDAVITQQLPSSMDYVAANPPPHRTGRRRLSWSLAIPAHGTVRITTTGTTGRHRGARPLDHVTQSGVLHRGSHRHPATTVCVREDTGPQSCATGRGALRPESLSRWESGALALGFAGAAVTALLTAMRVRGRRRRGRRRSPADALERVGVER
jgi:uncharacterized repeat protein (TIGR01451 family)